MANTTIVIPCFNEAQRLTGREFLRHLAVDESTRFLFVDDGSTDETVQVIQKLQDSSPRRIELLRLERNAGKSEAVRQGMLKCLVQRPDFIGYWDADLATPLGEIPRFREVLLRRPDVNLVLGTRMAMAGHHVHRVWHRRIRGRLFALAASRVLRMPIRDTQCGAKIFRVVPETEKLFQEAFRSRWIFDVELLARMKLQRNARVYECPLENWSEVPGSKLRMRDFVRAASELWSIHDTYFRRAGRAQPMIQSSPKTHPRAA